jgi:hypothetical protein
VVEGLCWAADVLEIKREERTGWILKYPAVKSQRAPANAGELDNIRRIVVTAGYSVEVSSGFKSGVNCETGYTKVWLDSDGSTGLLSDA